MGYAAIQRELEAGRVVVLDGGIGTELERRGVPMDPEAWCGPSTLDHIEVLEAIHRDYIEAGADVITANTFASSRLMLEPAGYADRFDAINRAAIEAARRARNASGRRDVAVAGSLSHMLPMRRGAARPDFARQPDEVRMAAAFRELAALHKAAGCDVVLLEMMYHPDRIAAAFRAAIDTGLPVWAGFSARRGADGRVLSFAAERDIPFEEVVGVLGAFDIAAAGVMHTPSDLIGDAVAILAGVFDGPLIAYPDSGYFTMPNWQFEDVIPPAEFLKFASGWVEGGVQVVGGCCGLSPEHIKAIAHLKRRERC